MKAVPLHPPFRASTRINRADDWTLDLRELENAFSSRTKMLVSAHSVLIQLGGSDRSMDRDGAANPAEATSEATVWLAETQPAVLPEALASACFSVLQLTHARVMLEATGAKDTLASV